MNWKKVLQWLWDNHQALIAGATSGVSFVAWAAAQITALLNKTPNGQVDEVTDEMMRELAASWAGPLPDPGTQFPPVGP